jgi:16S rRNA processing protein RimM
MNDVFVIGKIIGAHGVRGELKVYPLTDHVRRFDSLSECMLLSRDEKMLRMVKVKNVRFLADTVLLTIDDVSDRDEAQKMNGLYLAVLREAAAPLPAGRYYITDMIGCTVKDAEHGVLGTLADVLQTGANDVLIVNRSGKSDLLIPYLNAVVTEVDVVAKQIFVVLPDGLYEIYES